MIRPTYTDEDGWTFPDWWPKLARNVVETWSSAKRAGDADLFEWQVGQHDSGWCHFRAITYLTPDELTFGVGISRDWHRTWRWRSNNRESSEGPWVSLDLYLGPVLVTLALHAPYLERPRRVVSRAS